MLQGQDSLGGPFLGAHTSDTCRDRSHQDAANGAISLCRDSILDVAIVVVNCAQQSPDAFVYDLAILPSIAWHPHGGTKGDAALSL